MSCYPEEETRTVTFSPYKNHQMCGRKVMKAAFQNNGVLFGGAVRDMIVAEKHTKDFLY